jgi:transposase
VQLVEESGLAFFNNFVKTLKKWGTQIINYFRRRETSGFVEGFNNKVKVLKRRCYGIFPAYPVVT